MRMKRFLKSILLLSIFLLAFFATQLLISLIVGLIVGFIGGDLYSDEVFMLTYFLAMGGAYFATTLIERLAFKQVRPIAVSLRGFDPVAILLGVVLLVALSVVLLPLNGVLPADGREFPDGPYTLISVVVLAPILEELIFRGRLYNLFGRSASPLFAVSLSAIAFGIVHFHPIVVIEAILSGFILSYFYLYKRSIIIPIILHVLNNAMAYTLLVLSYQGESLRQIIGNQELVLPVYIVSVVIVVVGAIVIFRYLVKLGRQANVEVNSEPLTTEHYNSEPIDDSL